MEAVIFQIGSRRVAVDLQFVEEVISLGPITPVPAAPPAIVGAMNQHGDVVAVVDPRCLYGEPAAPIPASAGIGLLVHAEGCRVVLCVDRVEEVVALEQLGDSPAGAEPIVIELEESLRDLLQKVTETSAAWHESTDLPRGEAQYD